MHMHMDTCKNGGAELVHVSPFTLFPGIAPFDYHSFRTIKAIIARKRITKIEGVRKGIADLPVCWYAEATNDGDYIA